MLKAFRDNLKNLVWVLWAVIAAFVLLVFVDFGGAGFQGPSASNVVANVGDTPISVKEFQQAYGQLESQYRSLYGDSYTPELARQLQLSAGALNSVVTNKILVGEAVKMGLQATEKEIQDLILGVPAFQDSEGRFDQELYVSRLRRLGYLVPEWEQGIRDDILVGKLQDVLSQTIYVAASEVQEAYRDQVERAKIKYIQLARERFAARVSVDPADVDQYFETHLADYELPEQRRIGYLSVHTRALRATLEIQEEELRAYYDSQREEFTQEERVRARHILLIAEDDGVLPAVRQRLEALRRRIESGEDFGALAREYSEDEESRDRAGELGFFSRGRYTPALEDAAFGGQVGELLGPIETKLANQTLLSLIEVQAHQEGGLQGYQQVKPAIRSRLLSERSRERSEALAHELSGRVDSENLSGDDLRELAASVEGATFETPAPFGRNDNIAGIGRGTELTTTAFSLQPGEISDPFELTNGWALVYLEEIIEPRVPSLDEVEAEVRDAVREQKQAEAADDRLEGLLAELRGGLSMEEAAQQLQADLEESSEFGRDGFIPELGRQKQLGDEVFRLEEGGFGGPFSVDQSSLIFQVSERREWDPLEFEERKSETLESLTQERMNSLLFAIIQQQRLEQGVQTNQGLLEDLGVVDAPEASS